MTRETTSRAVWLVGPERVELREVLLPSPGPGELLLRVEAATTCGTDLKVWRRGGHPRMLVVPGPFGHEVAGVVDAVGDSVVPWRVGDRVVVANSSPCGACVPCCAGRENLCRDLLYLNGAFADRQLVPARFVRTSVHALPPGLAPELGALAEPLACVVHGVSVLGLALPELGVARPTHGAALVLGAGAIGLLWVAMLRACGFTVALGDPHPSRLAVGERMGAAATRVIDHAGALGPQLEALARGGSNGGGCDLVVDATGDLAVPSAALPLVRDGGTLLLFAGSPAGALAALDVHRLHYGEITLRGAYHHTPAAFRAALAALAHGHVDGAALLGAERPLPEVDAALRSMARREVLKVVLRP